MLCPTTSVSVCLTVGIHSQRDTIELNKVDAGWITEEGDEIEIEAIIPIAGTDVSSFCAAVHPLTNAAGARFMFAKYQSVPPATDLRKGISRKPKVMPCA
jgi:hypothetical protein